MVFNIVFISIGVVNVVGKVLFEVVGKFFVIVVCVFVVIGFLIEVNVNLEKMLIVVEVNVKFKEMVEGLMKGVF